MSGKTNLPDGRIPDRLPDGRPAVPWRNRWTQGPLPSGSLPLLGAWQFSSLWASFLWLLRWRRFR